MSHRSISVYTRVPHASISRSTKLLLMYALVMFIVRFADAIMAYVSPIYITYHTNNQLIMGLVIATSSMVGLSCDILFSKWFPGKKYQFFLLWGIIGAILFPVSLLIFPPIISIFILSMAIWGIYFELLSFSNFCFISHKVKHDQHALGWGILLAFMAVAYMTAPLVASILIEFGDELPLILAAIVGVVGMLAYLMLHTKDKHHIKHPPAPHHSLVHQLTIWRLLLRPLWPIMAFIFTLFLIDASFWTSGAIISEMHKQVGIPGGMIYVVYLLPALFMGVFVTPLARPFGKKKTAFIAGACSGIFFLIAGLSQNPYLFLCMIFIASVFIAIALPEINGAIEDYIERLKHESNTLVGLENAMNSLAYIISPIMAGIIASTSSHQHTFTVFGLVLVITALIAFIETPKKIRLPQRQISQAS